MTDEDDIDIEQLEELLETLNEDQIQMILDLVENGDESSTRSPLDELRESEQVDYDKSHNMGAFKKIMKKLNKCDEIVSMPFKNNKITLKAKNGEQFLIHCGQYAGMIYPLKSWLKKNTSLVI